MKNFTYLLGYSVRLLPFLFFFQLKLSAQNTFPTNGNVGIGTTSPVASSTLEIKSTSKGILIPRMTKAQRNNILVSAPANGLLIYQTNNSPGFYVYDGGWNPIAASLNLSNLSKNTQVNASLIPGTNDSITLGTSLKRWKNITTSSLTFGDGTTQTTASTASQWKSSGSNVYFNTGLVGIGISTPSAALQIDGGTFVALATGGYQVIGNTTGLNLALDPYNIQGRNNGSAGNISVNAFGGSTYLGNEASSYYGAVGYGASYGLYGETSAGVGVYGFSSTGSGLYGYASTSGGVNSRGVTAYGNFGVYATTADNAAYYAGFFVGDVYTSGIYASSDEKLKQNIQDISSAMSVISQLRPKTYQFKQDGDYKLMNLPSGQHYGLIAQEVEKVLPYLVKSSKFDVGKAKQNSQHIADTKNPGSVADASKTDESMSFKALNYTELIPIVVKGMQEQQAVIDKQEEEIKQLQKLVQNLMELSKTTGANPGTSLGGAYLLQNAPNPFTQNTVVRYFIPASVKRAQLTVYNMSGQVIKTYELAAGTNSVSIEAGILSAGQYSYSLLADGQKTDTKSMTITR